MLGLSVMEVLHQAELSDCSEPGHQDELNPWSESTCLTTPIAAQWKENRRIIQDWHVHADTMGAGAWLHLLAFYRQEVEGGAAAALE